MKERVDALVGRRSAAMWVSTFHSMCVRILRREAKHLGVRSQFSVYDADDTRRLVGLVARDLELDPKKFAARGLAAQISNHKNELLGPEDAAERATNEYERRVAEVYALYQARLRSANAFDFDDLIMETVRCFSGCRTSPSTTAAGSVTCSSTSTRTRTTRIRAGRELVAPAHAGVESGELSWSATPTSRSTPSAARASAHHRVRARLPDRAHGAAGAELPIHADDPVGRNAVIARNPDRRDKRLWTAAGDGPSHRLRRRQRARRGRVRRRRDRPAGRQQRDPQLRRRGLLPDERPVARVRRRVPAGRACRTGWSVGCASRAPGDPRRAGLPAGAVEPGRHCEPAADPERAQARHRRRAEEIVAQSPTANGSPSPPRCGSPPSSPNGWARWPPGRSAASPVSWDARRPGGARRAGGGHRGAAGGGLRPHRLHRRAGGERRPAGRVRVENLAELVTDAGQFAGDARSRTWPSKRRWTTRCKASGRGGTSCRPAGEPEPGSLAVFLDGSRWSPTPTDPGQRRRHGHADEPAYGQGAGVSGCVPQRAGGRGVPAPAGDVRSAELAEERRLAYVGITRARERLYLSRALIRSAFGQPNANPASRFLDEVPTSLVDWKRSEPERAAPVGRSVGRRSVGRTRQPEGARAHDDGHDQPGRGRRVNHDKYGLGTVIASDGAGPRATVTIDFGSAGRCG